MPAAPPSSLQTVASADGTEIGYELRGSGPGLVLVQGTMGTAYNFRDLADALAGSFTVVLPDRRGRGHELRDVAVPTLLLGGSRSQAYLERGLALAAGALPGAR